MTKQTNKTPTNGLFLAMAGATALLGACGAKMVGPAAGAGNGTSIVSSISGDEKDIKELSDNFKGLKSTLRCEGDKSWEASSVTLEAKSLEIVFKVKADLEGKECQVDLRGDLRDGKKAEWTSPDATVGLLYVSTKEKVASGALKVSFYKTFIATEAGKAYRALQANAKFTAKFLADGADKAVLKSVNLSCKDKADVSAKLDKDIEFAKDVKDAKAEILFPQVEVGKLEGCVFKALFDERTELSTDAMALTVEAGKDPQAVDLDFKNAVTLKDVKVDGTLSGQQLKDLVSAKDLQVAAAKADYAPHEDVAEYFVTLKLKAPKAAKCQIKAQGYDEKGKEGVLMSGTADLKAELAADQELSVEVANADHVAQKKFIVSAKCPRDAKWEVVKEIAAIGNR